MSHDDTTQPPQAQVRLLVNQHGLISGVRFTKQTPDVVFGDPEVVRIKPSGEVVIAEGANLDDAARAFWNAITEWRGDGSRPTLADAQPGGRVRLGDQAFAQGCDELRMRTEGERTAYLEGVAEGRKAALSAQPSPGGQGDAITGPMIEAAIAAFFKGQAWSAIGDRQAVEAKMLETLEAALAARQPSKQPDSVALGEATEFCIAKGDRQLVGQEAVVTSHWRNGRLNHILYCSPMPDGVHRLYAAPTAQAVDLGQFRDLIGFAVLQAINLPETDPRRDFIRQGNEFIALIDGKAVGNG